MAAFLTSAGSLASSVETPDTFGRIANVGALGTVALVAVVGLALIALVVMLIGWAGVLADYQSGRGGVRTVLWVILVFALPVVGTVAWALIGRRSREADRSSSGLSQEQFARNANPNTVETRRVMAA